MEQQIEEIELLNPSLAFEDFKKDFISKNELSELFNVSKAWLDKTFTKNNEKLMVVLTSLKKDENGDVREYRNRYLYYRREYITHVLHSSYWSCFDAPIEEYDNLKKIGDVSRYWKRIDSVRDIKLENIHAGYRMPLGGIREKTAIKNGYWRVVLNRNIILYYDNP